MLRYVLEPGAAQLPVPGKATAGPDPDSVLETLRKSTIGADEEVQTPFGSRRTVYADYTASGRACAIVEDFVRTKVLPCYGNTHTLTTATARQTTYLRAEAREVIRHHLNATHEDAIIFAGNGSTGAAHLFVQTLQRAAFNVGREAGAASGEAVRDMHYREDRWGGGECTLCNVRVKSAAIYQAHQHSEAHRARLRAISGQHGDAAEASVPRARARRRRVVVLADAVLHHSSSLPFREMLPQFPLQGAAALKDFSGTASRSAPAAAAEAPEGAVAVEVEVSTVPIDRTTGLLDEAELQSRLDAARTWQRGPEAEDCELVVICVLAAASNVTGLCTDVLRVTSLVRKTVPEAVVCWDYAAAAGHKPCDMNPRGDVSANVDAAFFSPHKLWGGPGSVGVLSVKKRLLCNAVPAVPGGGVVFYVSDESHSYIQNSEEREEAGTPNIVGCIRAGLAFHILDQIPAGVVEAREEQMLQRLLTAWSSNPSIELLGPVSLDGGKGPSRTGVVSFMIRYGNAKPGLYLHYNYVAALLNDLFGVQARGGCACAGPYAQWLLGIEDLSAEFEDCLMRTAQEVLRPGFVRVGVHWAMSDEDVDALVAAVHWVAEHGWKLLAAYTFDRETGEWLHRLDSPDRRRVWLSNIKVHDPSSRPIAALETSLGLDGSAAAATAPRDVPELLAAADRALKEVYTTSQVALSSSKWPVLNADYAKFLWFALPADVAFTLKSTSPSRPQILDAASVFASDAVARPQHSVLDAHKGKRSMEQEEAAQSPVAADEDWAPLEGMVLEEEDDEDSAAAASTFSRNQLTPSIPKPLRGLVGKAIADFGMINEGDKVLVGLSGGKDSLTVLHILLALKRSAPINFEVAAATVDPETPEFNPHPLREYMQAMGVEYHMLSKPIIEMAKNHMDPKRPSLCAFCSRMKRGMLYSCMREKGYNVLVLGQHLDDFAESFFMSAIHNGLLRTMKANYWVAQEDVRVCRPLIYVREAMAALFAKENQLPIIADNCPACFAAPKERHKTKILLSSLEFDYPQLFSTLLRTMRPLYALSTAERENGILAGEDDDGGEAGASAGRAAAAKMQAKAPAAARGRDVADEDADAELVLTSCGPKAAGGVFEEGAGCADGACGREASPAASPTSSAWADEPPRTTPPFACAHAAAGVAALGFALGAASALAAVRLLGSRR